MQFERGMSLLLVLYELYCEDEPFSNNFLCEETRKDQKFSYDSLNAMFSLYF